MAFMAQPWKDPRTGTYYIRRRIPKELRPLLPEAGETYKRSLGTKDTREAKTLFAAAWGRSEEFFLNIRLQLSGTNTPTLQDAIQLAARWAKAELDHMESTGRFEGYLIGSDDVGHETLRDHFNVRNPKALLAPNGLESRARQHLDQTVADELAKVSLPMPLPGTPFHKYLYEAFLAQHLELSEIAYKRHYGDYSAVFELPHDAPLSIDKVKAESPTETLSVVFEHWSRNHRHMGDGKRDVEKTAGEYQTTIVRFIELLGDLPVKQIKRRTIEEFYNLLRQLPSKGEGLKGLNAHEQIARAKQLDLPLLSSATIKNKLMGLSSVLAYAVQMEYITENPVVASGITKSLRKASAKQSRTATRKGFTQAELIQVFSSPLFKGEWIAPRASFGEAWKWLPLLLCYTGARREEIAQMKASEVRKSEDGIWHLDLLGVSEDGVDDDRTLKTKGSHRLVVIHQDLIELGFIEYVEGLPASGQLFPALKPNPTGWYGHNFGKRWGAYLREVAELETPVSPSHGFRHSFKTMCREAGIPEEIHDAITGHDDGSVSRSYGERHLLKTQRDQLARLPHIAVLAGLLPDRS
ncbi:hypothetical protein AL048_03030 [Pseudomonas syringae pv. castaneae]|nr:hypothetical protein AL048_03030 [Pseudomonas syringae pv. castaneae]